MNSRSKRSRPVSKAASEPIALRKFRSGFRWDCVALEPYKIGAHKGGDFRGASRQVLAGKTGERVGFHVRYFELESGGFTSLERHRHSHFIIAIRGCGVCRLDDEEIALRPMDAIYIGPNRAHQLVAAKRGKFGFLCIVDAKRDEPRPVDGRR